MAPHLNPCFSTVPCSFWTWGCWFKLKLGCFFLLSSTSSLIVLLLIIQQKEKMGNQHIFKVQNRWVCKLRSIYELWQKAGGWEEAVQKHKITKDATHPPTRNQSFVNQDFKEKVWWQAEGDNFTNCSIVVYSIMLPYEHYTTVHTEIW